MLNTYTHTHVDLNKYLNLMNSKKESKKKGTRERDERESESFTHKTKIISVPLNLTK